MPQQTVQVVTSNGEVVCVGGQDVTITVEDAIEAVGKIEEFVNALG
ncbi:hypothetical protein [Vibrio coralliilyticus]|nr:hypothetical protein [Vibrio coralliilyticus]